MGHCRFSLGQGSVPSVLSLEKLPVTVCLYVKIQMQKLLDPMLHILTPQSNYTKTKTHFHLLKDKIYGRKKENHFNQ